MEMDADAGSARRILAEFLTLFWVKVLLVVLALTVTAATARIFWPGGHMVDNSFSLDTSGSTGRLVGTRWEISLPLSVSSGLDYQIYEVEMGVEVFGCRDARQAIEACKRLASFSEIFDDVIEPRSHSTQVHYQSGPLNLEQKDAYTQIRITSVLLGMKDELMRQDEAEDARLEAYTAP